MEYEEIFRHRGSSYHKAMVDYPSVRGKEFQNLFLRLPLKDGEKIVDCPALGGYLSKNINVPIQVESLDYCPQGDNVKLIGDYKTREKVDRVVCLASSHHINDLEGFIGQLSSFLREGGYLHLADVNFDSPIRLFLDDFVGQWTSTGHSGIWRDLGNAPTNTEAGLQMLNVEERECPWEFQNTAQMVQFCRLLFGLDLNPSDEQIVDALDRYVGLSRRENNCTVQWKLMYVDFLRNV